MSYALKGKYPTINGKERIQAFHVNHHYEIKGLPSNGLNNAPIAKKENSPEFKENMRLGEEWGGIGGLYRFLSSVTNACTGGELQCAEYVISKCSETQFCIVKNQQAKNDGYCKHDNQYKITSDKLEQINHL